MSGFVLKLIAIAAMAVDHTGAVFFPGVWWMRLIGRLTMPVMAFLMAEGYHYTKDRKKYMIRLVIFGLVSQLPFSAAFGTMTLDVMFTLAAAVFILYIHDSGLPVYARVALIVAAFVLSAFSDWAIYGVLYVCVFYALRQSRKWQCVGFSAVSLLMCLDMFIGGQFPSALWVLGVFMAIPLFLLYNGKRGHNMKWFFYAFYPAHLAVIALIKYFVF